MLRYIKNHSHQLDYKTALAQGLPIGSGEIESAHRYVIQQRLKLSGAWWTPDNAASKQPRQNPVSMYWT
ncbi:MAG: hypothetical protein CVV13_01590 [Gammaproteobacteria bacterium HGW-Gammaproteobacteria-3]|nr:MAG: hypothetical protein CVV13_01590 [Gammaproteobacteria bacterium HGW-Gammaproteobacteria-3]